MRPLASALTKLSSETEAVVRYGTPPADATDEELLKLATRNDPGFLDTFRGYRLRVRSEERHAAVLLCSEDAAYRLRHPPPMRGSCARPSYRMKTFTLKAAFAKTP